MRVIDLRDPPMDGVRHKLFSYREVLMLTQPVGYANAVHRQTERAINESTVRVRRARLRPTDRWPLQRNR